MLNHCNLYTSLFNLVIQVNILIFFLNKKVTFIWTIEIKNYFYNLQFKPSMAPHTFHSMCKIGLKPNLYHLMMNSSLELLNP
jgi:hypothetical protein